jgi:predicted RNA-binding protein YlxR (DUF448 family)
VIAAAMIDRRAEPRTAAATATDAERRCLVTGQTVPRAQLIRFVAGPDGAIVPDLGERLPGRGLWVMADRDALARADARAFARARRGPVTVPDDLPARVEAGLRRRLVDYIGMARRAGALVAGFEKTRAVLRSGAAHLLIAAGDGSDDGRAKLRALAPGLAEMTALSAEEIGAALGRDGIVHAAVTEPRLAAVIAREAGRLAGVRGGPWKMRRGADSDKVDTK